MRSESSKIMFYFYFHTFFMLQTNLIAKKYQFVSLYICNLNVSTFLGAKFSHNHYLREVLHTYKQINTLTNSHTHSHSHPHTHAYTHTHTHTNSHTHAHATKQTHTHTHTQPNKHTHTRTRNQTNTHTHARNTHTHTMTYTSTHDTQRFQLSLEFQD